MSAIKLKKLLRYHGISQAALADGIQLSTASVSLLVNRNRWPTSLPRTDIEARIIAYLQQHDITDMQLVGIFQSEDAPSINAATHKPRIKTNPQNAEELSLMLLRKQQLHPQTKQHFGLFRDPFSDPQSSEDLFVSPEIRYIRETLFQVTRYGAFIALVGESGSGKSTLRKDLHARLLAESKSVVIIEPYILGMEDNDRVGKTLKASHICEAIMASIAPGKPLPSSSERRFRAVHEALRESHRMGNKHVLVIEEAHALPIPTLKHLKRFFELEDGFQKLLSIVLIGQTELGQKLSEARADVREVVQRCEVVRLNPLDTQLGAYLRHRFEQVDKKLDEIMDEKTVEALREKLTGKSTRGQAYSVLYPLAVHNVVTAALNLAGKIGAAQLSPEIIAEV